MQSHIRKLAKSQIRQSLCRGTRTARHAVCAERRACAVVLSGPPTRPLFCAPPPVCTVLCRGHHGHHTLSMRVCCGRACTSTLNPYDFKSTSIKEDGSLLSRKRNISCLHGEETDIGWHAMSRCQVTQRWMTQRPEHELGGQ